MIFIESRDLPDAAARELEGWQAEIDRLPDYAQQVERSKVWFSSRNNADNRVFSEARRILDEMCQGARRCGYCEDSCADEIEHIRPKSLYPDSVFRWINYLYSCGICNGGKNNHYAVFDGEATVSVSRGPKDPVVPPRAGAPLFLDPRRENALDYLFLDLRDTFRFSAFALPGTREYSRGDYTIDKLRLNREVLVKARRNAFAAYKRKLEAYIGAAQREANRQERADRKREILESDHRTVWCEMQRQVQQFPSQHPKLRDLFIEAPEALHW